MSYRRQEVILQNISEALKKVQGLRDMKIHHFQRRFWIESLFRQLILLQRQASTSYRQLSTDHFKDLLESYEGSIIALWQHAKEFESEDLEAIYIDVHEMLLSMGDFIHDHGRPMSPHCPCEACNDTPELVNNQRDYEDRSYMDVQIGRRRKKR